MTIAMLLVNTMEAAESGSLHEQPLDHRRAADFARHPPEHIAPAITELLAAAQAALTEATQVETPADWHDTLSMHPRHRH